MATKIVKVNPDKKNIEIVEFVEEMENIFLNHKLIRLDNNLFLFLLDDTNETWYFDNKKDRKTFSGTGYITGTNYFIHLVDQTKKFNIMELHPSHEKKINKWIHFD